MYPSYGTVLFLLLVVLLLLAGFIAALPNPETYFPLGRLFLASGSASLLMSILIPFAILTMLNAIRDPVPRTAHAHPIILVYIVGLALFLNIVGGAITALVIGYVILLYDPNNHRYYDTWIYWCMVGGVLGTFIGLLLLLAFSFLTSHFPWYYFPW